MFYKTPGPSFLPWMFGYFRSEQYRRGWTLQGSGLLAFRGETNRPDKFEYHALRSWTIFHFIFICEFKLWSNGSPPRAKLVGIRLACSRLTCLGEENGVEKPARLLANHGSAAKVLARNPQSQTQSLQAFLSAVGRLERLWDNFFEYVLIFFYWLLFCKRSIKKFKEYSKKFHFPRVSPGDQPLTKNRRNSGLEIDETPNK